MNVLINPLYLKTFLEVAQDFLVFSVHQSAGRLLRWSIFSVPQTASEKVLPIHSEVLEYLKIRYLKTLNSK